MELNKKNLTFSIKSEAETGIFEGWASVYDIVDHHNEVMQKGCFAKCLQNIQTGAEKMPLLLWSHDLRQPPIGKWLAFMDTDKGLYVKGMIFDEAPPLLKRGMKEGAINGLSVGFYGTGTMDKNSGTIVWTECTLKETSLCNFGANPGAVLTQVKAGEKISKRGLENILRDSGYSKSHAQAIVSAYDPHLRDSDEERQKLIAEIIKTAKSIGE